MRQRFVASMSVIAIVAAVAVAAQERGGGQRAGGPAGPAMTMTVAGFPDGGQFPVKNSQAAEGAAPGEGPSPAITWANAPTGTQSFVLHLHDMDLARNRTTDDQPHWVVWNIPATGPMHHYVFELFALDAKLDVQPTADAFETRANVLKAIQGHILAKAVYGGLFRRPQ